MAIHGILGIDMYWSLLIHSHISQWIIHESPRAVCATVLALSKNSQTRGCKSKWHPKWGKRWRKKQSILGYFCWWFALPHWLSNISTIPREVRLALVGMQVTEHESENAGQIVGGMLLFTTRDPLKTEPQAEWNGRFYYVPPSPSTSPFCTYNLLNMDVYYFIVVIIIIYYCCIIICIYTMSFKSPFIRLYFHLVQNIPIIFAYIPIIIFP